MKQGPVSAIAGYEQLVNTLYNIRHKGCHCIHHDKHPDGFPEYAPCLVYIKPGGKELLITWGYERSKREFKLEEK